MTKKILVILAIALIALCSMASAASYRDYDMKYSDPVANDNAVDPSYSSGQLYIDVTCMNNLFSKDIVIQRVAIDNSSPSFVTGRLVQKDFIDKFSPDGKKDTIQLGADGKYDTRIVPGTFALTLVDGNGGAPEYMLVTIVAGHASRVHFIGHASTPASAEAAAKTLTITKAVYGTIVTIPGTDPVYEIIHHGEVNHTIHHDAGYETVYIGEVNHTIYHDAVYTTVHHDAVYETIHHDAVYTTVHHDAIPAVPATPAWDEHFGDFAKHGNHYDYVGTGNGDYVFVWGGYGGSYYQYIAPVHHAAVPGTPATPAWDEQVLVTADYDEEVLVSAEWDEQVLVTAAYNETIIDTPAHEEQVLVTEEWDEIVVDEAAWDETVTIPGTPETTTGSYIDVTGIVQGLVSNGELHIAADYPNLHYNALFTDPCVGYVKTLKVNYQLNGAAGTKTVSETEDLDIA